MDISNRDAGGELAVDVVKGAIAGAVAVWVMDRVGCWMWNQEDATALQQEREARPQGMDPAHVVANRVAEVAGTALRPPQPHAAGVAVHYAIGMAPAMLYAPLRRQYKGLGAGRGLLYGFGLFLLVDEGVVPAMGLASGPAAYPWQAHARGLATHLVLGAVTDGVLNAMDQVA